MMRYQLWMQMGNPKTQGRANFAFKIIDTQEANLRAQQMQVLEDGYSLWGQSNNMSEVEHFAREMECLQREAIID